VRIVHVIEGLHPDRGGPPVVAMSLAAAQVRLGHKATIVCEEPGSRPDGVDVLIRATRDAEHVRIERIPKQKLFGGLHGSLVGHAKAVDPAPDLFHIHGVWNPILLVGGRTARQQRVPFVLSTHGALHPDMLQIGAMKKRAALAIGWSRLLRDARRVLTLNDEERSQVDRMTRRANALSIPNGVDLDAREAPPLGSFRSTYEPLEGRPYFVFLGRLDKIKGLDLLLDAFLLARSGGSGADLVLVGPDWGEQQAIQGIAARAGIAKHVHCTGPLYDQRKLAALRDAIALVHRPRYEGFGLAVVEAMSVGTPAVIGERCLLPATGVDEGVVSVVGDAAAFARAMLELERSPERRSTMSAAAIDCVRRRFDWKPIAQATLAAAGFP
jgi:glycosyltransferase involved in cell wall biosynthesis